MIQTILRSLYTMPWTFLLSVLLGVLLALSGGSIVDFVYDSRDKAFPVLTTKARLLEVTSDYVIVEITGEKLREDCEYLRFQAYSRADGGVMRDAYTKREDRPEINSSKPAGAYNFGVWRVWPMEGAMGVVMFAQHQCGSRVISTKIADLAVDLPRPALTK